MLIQSFKYKRWADQRTLKVIKEIDRHKCPSSYEFILQQINHMVIVEELFSSRLRNEPAPHRDTNSLLVPEFEELTRRLIESCEWYLDYALNLQNPDKQIVFTFADGKQGNMKIREILFHIVNHGTYHRGNIAHALDLSGVPHPTDGYGIFIHELEPERRES